MNICIYGSANEEIDISFRIAGERLGELIAINGHTLIFGGGASGMMGAVARGVKRNGGKVIGISPEFFDVDGILYDQCTEMIYTKDMRSRKEKLESMAEAFIVTPGGIGTMDEFFETVSLKQLNQLKKPLIIYNVNGYYDNLTALLKKSADMHFVAQEDLNLYKVTDDPKKVLEYIK
ncbi:MAG: TIGR00730 family Rossman fold protein [Clostridia bacterium]|nr:TIGR00730 family Rossman fold protein [Clostridia bacterium]